MPEIANDRLLTNVLGNILHLSVIRRNSVPSVTTNIAEAALKRILVEGKNYAYDKAPTSPYANLSGNLIPNQTKIAWLKNVNKCNQFIGDVLTDAGYQVPTYKMSNGREHFVMAEAMPQYHKYFNRISDKASAKSGDILLIDYLDSQGESSAHAEIIIDPYSFITAGAHKDGAYTKNFSLIFANKKFNNHGNYWYDNDVRVYILRPKLKVDF